MTTGLTTFRIERTDIYDDGAGYSVRRSSVQRDAGRFSFCLSHL